MSGRARTPVQGEVPNPLEPADRLRLPPALPARQRALHAPSGRRCCDFDGVPVACHAVEEGRISAARRSAARGSRRSPRNRSERCSRSRISHASLAVDHHLGRARPAVVVARHAHAVGAGRQHGEQVAGLRRRARGRARASRPTRRPGRRRPTSRGAASRSAHGTMPIQASYIAGRIRSFIAASTMQKFFVVAGLEVQHLGHQHAGVADQRAARLEQDLAMAMAARVDALAAARPPARRRRAASRRCR